MHFFFVPHCPPFRFNQQGFFVVEVCGRILEPSKLPPNARVRATFKLVAEETPVEFRLADKPLRDPKAFGIYTDPTPNWSKILHALDADVYTVYRAPVDGQYQLELTAAEDEVTLFSGERWREAGKVALINEAPKSVKWPKKLSILRIGF